MTIVLLLAAASSPMPTLAPDTRTAAATERLASATLQLASATWWLVAVGLATFVAAVLAAAYAARAYRLEASPTIVITRAVEGLKAEGPQAVAQILGRDPDPNAVIRASDPPPPVLLRPYRQSDDSRFPTGQTRFCVVYEVRNVGRSPVVGATLHFDLHVAEFPIDRSFSTRTVDYGGKVELPAIAANSYVLLPVVNALGGGAVMDISAVTGTRARRTPVRPGKGHPIRLPFVAESVRVAP
jgi:hypothetical protein